MESRIVYVAFAAVLLLGSAWVEAAESCCGDLGCFSSDKPFFHLLYRPVLSVPNCAIIPKLKLHLNTRENPVDTQVLDLDLFASLSGSHLGAHRDTKILIHGHTDNYDGAWWKDVRTEFLLEGDFNVIRVDWSAGNTPPYIQAIANSRLVGAHIAKLIRVLRDRLSFDVKRIHIIGHSLGAHTAGYAGELTPGLGRITGIDPAGPGYTNMPIEVRLDPTDASVVDTIVTDGVLPYTMGMGSSQAMGHLNFYPNGGTNQPGCDQGPLSPFIHGPSANTSNYGSADIFSSSFYEALGCSHIKALTMFQETISSKKCVMKAFQCDSYESFQRGNCFSCRDHKCSLMGLHANVSLAEPLVAKHYFLKSTARPPFCANSYKVEFGLEARNNANNAREERGQLFLQLFGNRGSSEMVPLTESDTDLTPGKSFTQMIAVPGSKEVGNIETIVFRWQAKRNVLSPISWLRKDAIFIDGNFTVTSEGGVRNTFRPQRVKVEDKQDVIARMV